ncbi:glutamine--fructose-6-phosphate transaminase (isomerizing), partial [bacterium]|nr:glutamine--fructose-6-phosphate transaminase (isomerizing) [bacterium]
MCGIVGITGNKQVAPILVEGLKRLEYRGYDSAGISVANGGIKTVKCPGKISALEVAMIGADLTGTCGIAHTRWATHGPPSQVNAHPHMDSDSRIAVVHNGIIENFQVLKHQLVKSGYEFCSETDSEVLAHLIREFYDGNLEEAVRRVLELVEGTYGIAAIHSDEPDKIVGARRGSPLVVGVGEGSNYLASDVAAILGETRKVIYLDDGEMVTLTPDSVVTTSVANELIDKEVQEIHWDLEQIQKGGFPHFMLKEIYEQPETIKNAYRGRILPETGDVKLAGLRLTEWELRNIRRIIILACGTSWHAGLVGEYLIEEYAGIPVEVEYASEFRYRSPVIEPGTLCLTISQSGETIDTLEAMREAKRRGAKVLGITNVVGSTIARETDGGIYIHAGPEIGVASTKAFTSQLTALFLLTLFLGQVRKTISPEKSRELAKALVELPAVIEKDLPRLQDRMDEIAEEFSRSRDFLYLGRGANFPIALEGALKLKEISYIHAEGYAAGELKHGPIALIDRDMPVLALAPKDSVYSKLISNVEEVKARHGRIILVGSETDKNLAAMSDYVIYMSDTHEELTPILYSIP